MDRKSVITIGLLRLLCQTCEPWTNTNNISCKYVKITDPVVHG